MQMTKEEFGVADLSLVLILVVAGLSLPAAWLTHVIYSIGAETWGFLIAGAVFFPVGILHGYMVWLGVA